MRPTTATATGGTAGGDYHAVNVHVDEQKQATKALKCVAFATHQVGELRQRQHDRVLKRIRAVAEEIESLKTDVAENITHQRERRQQVGDVEEDIERAQMVGNSAMVTELYQELKVLKDEAKREESLYRALCKTIRSRKEIKKQFMAEKDALEEEMRSFNCKQKLIQTLLATCTRQSSSSVDYTQGSSASQSDCGASDLEDDNSDEDTTHHACAPVVVDSPIKPTAAAPAPLKSVLRKSVSSAVDTIDRRGTRVRSWSSDCVTTTTTPERVATRSRHSLSVHFASPTMTFAAVNAHEEEIMTSLELTSPQEHMEQIAEVPSNTASVPIELPEFVDEADVSSVPAAPKGDLDTTDKVAADDEVPTSSNQFATAA